MTDRSSRAVALAAVTLLAAATGSAQVNVNTTQLLWFNPTTLYSSCWGWTAPNGHELALLGAGSGTYIVDVTVPSAPVQLALIPGLNSIWREMKTYDHYAYIVTEANPGGMQIVDLAASPPALVATYTTTFTTAHTITIAGPWAYLSGTHFNNASTGLRILSLADPVNPVDVGSWNDYYTHDCTIRGNRLWASCINNRLLAVVDITNRAAPTTVATFTWSGNFNHNTDLTADGQYVLTTDENTGGHLHIFDVSDVGAPRLVAEWTANPNAIIHNVHIRGDLAFVSYYTEGTRIVDLSLITRPLEIGWFDTWSGISGGFNGNWEVYPYAASGNAYLSDRASGLYVVRYDAPGRIGGVVRDAATAAPLASAKITISGLAGGVRFSDDNGNYRLFSTGTQSVTTEMFGYASESVNLDFTAGTSTTRDVALAPLPGAPVTGTITDAVTSLPVSGVHVRVDGTPLTGDTNASGVFALSRLPAGVYTLHTNRIGYVDAARTLVVTDHGGGAAAFATTIGPVQVVWDFESGPQGWTVVHPVDDSDSGDWVWGDPIGSGVGTVQPEDDHTPSPGTHCWVTGQAAKPGDSFDAADVDGGRTVLLSPAFDATGGSVVLSYWRWFTNSAGVNAGTDSLHVELSNNDGASWTAVEHVSTTAAAWTQVVAPIASVLAPTATMRLRVSVADRGGDSTVEAAFDDVQLTNAAPTGVTAVPRYTDRLWPAAPNPFNPATRCRYELGQPGRAELRIFDARGRIVRTLAAGWQSAGPHEIEWNGRDDAGHAVASGAYWVRLESRAFDAAGRLVLVK